MDRPPLETLLPEEMRELRWKPLMSFFLDIKPPYNVGRTPGVQRRISELVGGYFQGEKLRGKVLGGNDWQAVRDDTAVSIDVRALLETDDGALISMTYQGLRHGPQDVIAAMMRGEAVSPRAYYMRATVSFETAVEKYDWLNRVVAIGHGHRLQTGAIYNVFEIV